ncbi:protein kinase containing Z-DNA binding domains [Clarias gariepinus]
MSGEIKEGVNKHLYNLERSKKVFKTDGQPPVWNLLENKSQKTDEEEEEEEEHEGAAASQTKESAREEERVMKSLKSGGLKASQVARDLGQQTKSTKKLLYSMMEKGKVQKDKETNEWTLNKGEKTKESLHSLASLSGLSESFDLMKELGSGGFGEVYKVKHKFDGKIYAVKRVVLTEEADSEVKALARLEHPNIVRYITCWPDSENWTDNGNQLPNTSGSLSDIVTFERSGPEKRDDDADEDDADEDDADEDDKDLEISGISSLSLNGSYLFIQMEFCEGGTLTSWIEDRNFMRKQRNTVETNKIFYEIIRGVEYIHSEKLIHRDLKPDNILFTANGKVKIGDFGLVAVQENHSMGAIYRTEGKGTPSYMSPEQDSKRYNEKTDIFPLGLIWFEMLWKLSTYTERKKLWQDLRDQKFPEGFCDTYRTENKFIKRMLSFTPEDRPSAKQIKLKMKEFLFLDQNQLSQRTC